MKHFVAIALLAVSTFSATAVADDGKKKLVLIAGKMSHPPLMHEFRAGCLILEECLKAFPGLVVERHDNGWVKDETTFADADAVVIYADGGGRHPALQGDHLQTLGKLMKKGVGFGCMHYGVEVPPGKANDEFKNWIGGHYEHSYSCNPIWEPNFAELPKHPITQGVKPFQIKDEWYFNMRFIGGIPGAKATEVEGLKFTPILVATPSKKVRGGPYVWPKGPYDHIVADEGRAEAMMWAVERPDGGRGFGFTGGHFHLNWGNDDFRKTILNAFVWLAKAKVPQSGVASEVKELALYQNLDPKKKPLPKDALDRIKELKAGGGKEAASAWRPSSRELANASLPTPFQRFLKSRRQ